MQAKSTGDDPARNESIPTFPPSLTKRQRSLCERLADRDPALADMYGGTLHAAAADYPDHLAQAAHSARELIAKLVRLPAEPPKKGVGNPRDKGRELRDRWVRYKRASGVRIEDLTGNTVETGLVEVLIKVDEFTEASLIHKPARKLQAELALRKLGISDEELPDGLFATDLEEWTELWTFFEKASHHGSVLSLWERTVEWTEERPGPERQTPLAAFGWWYGSGALDREWSDKQMLELLSNGIRLDPDFEVVERLKSRATENIEVALKLTRTYVESLGEGWELHAARDEVRFVLAAALESDSEAVVDEAKQLVHYLGSKGLLDFRDLLGANGADPGQEPVEK